MSDSGAPGSHVYRTVASREVFNGRIVNLRVDTVTMPGGGTAEREICGHDDAAAVVAAPDMDTAEEVSATIAMRPLMDLPCLRWAPARRRAVVSVTSTPL